MAHLEAALYKIPCTKRGCAYFPAGVREGLFLKLSLDDFYGVGEYAPLTKIHVHSIADALSMAKELPHHCLKDLVALDHGLSLEELAAHFEQFPYPLSYLLSMAHFHDGLRSRSKECSERLAVRISGFIDQSSVNDAVTLAQRYVSQGYSCLKIKVGSSLEDEIRKIKTISSVVGKNVSLRLDANRGLSVFEAEDFLHKLRKVNIEYFEEPSFDLLPIGLVPLAIDESFNPPFNFESIRKIANFVIIKPSRFHSLYQAMHLAKKACLLGIEPIFSPCFESEFTSAIVAHVIDDLGLYDRAHGILVEDFFKHGVFKKPLRTFRGQLFIDAANDLTKGRFWNEGHFHGAVDGSALAFTVGTSLSVEAE